MHFLPLLHVESHVHKQTLLFTLPAVNIIPRIPSFIRDLASSSRASQHPLISHAFEQSEDPLNVHRPHHHRVEAAYISFDPATTALIPGYDRDQPSSTDCIPPFARSSLLRVSSSVRIKAASVHRIQGSRVAAFHPYLVLEIGEESGSLQAIKEVKM